MTFWDGTRWVPEATTPPPATPASTRRLRLPRRLPFLAVALGALLMIPTLGAGVPSTLGDTDLAASGPTVTLTGAAAPGVLVTIDGRGFRARTTYQVRWDSASHPLRLVWTDGAGRFHGHLRIPTTATDGRHYATFSLVAKAAAARVQAGTLQMSALVRTPSAVHLAVVVSRRRQPSPTPTPTPTPAGPTISAVTASSIDQTGATVSWTLSKPATGQVEFGTTTAYGRTTTAELSFSYSAHVQRLLALTPATVYHFRVRSQDASGHLAISGDRTFTTLGTAAPAPSPDPTASPTPTPAPSPTDTPVPSPTDTPVPSPTDTPVPTPIPTPAPTPVPTPTPTPTATPTPTPTATPTPTPTATPNPGGLTGYYGTLAADTKSNVQDHGKVAHRFVSPVTGLITSIRIQERGGPVYSGGTGGTYRFGIQADNGAGRPTGTYIGTTGSYVPGNSGVWDRFDAVAVSASVTAGQVLYAVFENIDGNPSANYFSVNEIYTYTHMTPRQPRFSDADFQVLSYDSGVWTNHTETADMDVSYANGAHAGQSFIGMIGINGMSVYAATISGSSQVRETLSPTGTRVFTQASVRVRRTSGSDPLVLSLVNASGGVTVLGSVPASAVPQSAAGGDNGGSVWVTVTFPATSFSGGSLLLTTASTSAYTAAPIRDGADSGFDASLGFPDGAFQVTGNAGSTWAAAYASAPLDLQFYFR